MAFPLNMASSSFVGSLGSRTGGSLISMTTVFPRTSNTLAEIIPPVLRCDDPVADKHDLAVLNVHLRGDMAGNGDEVVEHGGGERHSTDVERDCRRGGDSVHGDILEVGAVRVARSQPQLLEFLRQVIDRQFLAGASRGSPLELIRGEHLDVIHHPVRRGLILILPGGLRAGSRGACGQEERQSRYFSASLECPPSAENGNPAFGLQTGRLRERRRSIGHHQTILPSSSASRSAFRTAGDADWMASRT